MPIIALTVIHVVRPDRVEPRGVVNGEVRVTQPPNDQVALKLVCKNGAPPPNPRRSSDATVFLFARLAATYITRLDPL